MDICPLHIDIRSRRLPELSPCHRSRRRGPPKRLEIMLPVRNVASRVPAQKQWPQR
jgi:hypothetical protein